MELRALRNFIAVAETGSLSAAAQRVHISQPSLSRQLSALERELGRELFERSAQGMALNAAGRYFLSIATDLCNRAETGKSMMRAHDGPPAQLSVACPSATVTHVIAPFLAATGAPIGDALIRDPAEVYSALRHGDADMAVTTALPPAALERMLLHETPLNIQMPMNHPLAALAQVDVAEAAHHRLILMGRRSAVRAATEAAFRRAGVLLTDFAEPESSSMAQAMAAAGRGACIVLDDPNYGLASRPLTCDEEVVTSPIYGGWDRLHYAHREIREVMLGIQDWLRSRHPVPPVHGT
jgi:DNA-binding transcriptional LysR family regulator